MQVLSALWSRGRDMQFFDFRSEADSPVAKRLASRVHYTRGALGFLFPGSGDFLGHAQGNFQRHSYL